MGINSALKAILHAAIPHPLAGYIRNADNTTKLDVVVSEIVDLVALNPLTPASYDYIQLGYTGTNLTSVVYRDGGAGGTVIANLALAYDGADNLISVTKT
jgi:hypothetical protein